MYSKLYSQIYEIAANTKAINTHSHHLEDYKFLNFNLENLLNETYINSFWGGVNFDSSKQSRENFINKVRFKSYFKSLQKAIKQIYGIQEDLTSDTWDIYSTAISEKHKDNSWHKTILYKYCNYEKIILDAPWNPGGVNGDSNIFVPTFRVDPLFLGFSKEIIDHDGNNVFRLYGKEFDDLDSFLEFAHNLITTNIRNGSVAIKNVLAYDRNINFKATTKDKACRVFKNKGYTAENVAWFQDFLFYDICKLAASLDVPIQCHTGLGCLDNTRAMNMLEIIKANPDTKFVLFHGGFPWCDDTLAYLHNLKNVYCDICWLPILSPTTAEDLLNKIIEVGTSDKVCWGCDTWTSEESFGARLRVNEVLASVLSSKIEKGYLNVDEAKVIVENILYNNPKKLYKIGKETKKQTGSE